MTKIAEALEIRVSVRRSVWDWVNNKPTWKGLGNLDLSDTRYISVWLGDSGFYPGKVGGEATWPCMTWKLSTQWREFRICTCEEMVPTEIGQALLRQHADFDKAPDWIRQFAEGVV